ncbi:hypothetical protein AJ88_13300 [Mesorhizobium amorphae CCBAU 01583]|nr:hypothetical protein AJ88_13300 [Mesorhizobium amorphae CCBAU 01583]
MVDEKFGPVANDRYRDYLRDINRSGNHVLDLVNDLLDISKIEAGQQEMDYEAVSLNDTLAETVAMMQPQANRERVIIRSTSPRGCRRWWRICAACAKSRSTSCPTPSATRRPAARSSSRPPTRPRAMSSCACAIPASA